MYHRFTSTPAQLKPVFCKGTEVAFECDQVDFKSCESASFRGYHTSVVPDYGSCLCPAGASPGTGWSCCSQGLLTVHSPADTLLVSPTPCRPSPSPEAMLARAARSTSTPRSTHTLRYVGPGSGRGWKVQLPDPEGHFSCFLSPRDALDLSDIDSEPPHGSFPSFEPRNLLSMFEDSLGPT